MAEKVIIFGIQDFASLAHFYLRHDSDYEVAAFCVSAAYLPESHEFEGLEVVAFEEVQDRFPVSDFEFFAPMSHRKMNRMREKVYLQIKEKGYRLINYISSKATRFPGLLVGDNCFILEDNTIQPCVKIGSNVVLWSGNHIGHHSEIGDHVLFTSHVVLSGHCKVEPYAFFGVNATVRDNIRIAEGSLIAMAATITKDTEPWGVYKGSPAKKGEILSKDLDI
jgi:sugar O-acyltransferase (sialic acid O-acetyltransferase NeuD family)